MTHHGIDSRDSIEQRASFSIVRYAQVWEDADVLLEGLSIAPGEKVLSICSAGDNVLALLTADPGMILAVDLSPVQLQCLRLRMSAYRVLDHAGLLELLGSRPSDRRLDLLKRCVAELPETDWALWSMHQSAIVEHGLGGIGKFERYFRIFRKHVLPLVHGRSHVDSLLEPKRRVERERFFDAVWDNRRWRWMLKAFFSNQVMGRLGRDPEFFAQATTSLSDQVALRTRHAFVELDPSQNPYLHWILRGTHGKALPMALREENFETIRSRLDRIEMEQGLIDADLFARHGGFDAYNLSDIFEYMPTGLFYVTHDQIVAAANPGARILYWNMLVSRGAELRRRPRLDPHRPDGGPALHAKDKAFFYSAVRLEHVLGQGSIAGEGEC